jgi:hypothetical protein
MNELQKYMLMLQGGYKPQAGAITSDQMQGFKNAGLLNKTVALENQIQDTNNLIGSLNIPKQPIAVPNTANEDLLKKQKKANMFMALGDLLQGKDATAGFTQRQAGFDAKRDLAERQAKQEQILASMSPEQRKIYELYGPEAAFDYKYNKPKPTKRDSFVAKDGYRYFVDDNTRVFPGVTVKEEQSEADKYKENSANIKNIVMNEGIESTKLTQQQKDYYNNDLNKQGVLSLDQALASVLVGESGGGDEIQKTITENNKTYTYLKTNSDGSKVYVNGGKEYVFQD